MSASGTVAPRGSIALSPADCTACMICVRECPVWCIRLDSHEEPVAGSDPRRPRTRAVLDGFEIDFAVCMFCGACVTACPFDALAWVPETGSAIDRAGLKAELSELAALWPIGN